MVGVEQWKLEASSWLEHVDTLCHGYAKVGIKKHAVFSSGYLGTLQFLHQSEGQVSY